MYAVLQSVNTRTEKMERDQVKLFASVNDIKKNEEVIECPVNDVDCTLAAVEAKVCDDGKFGKELLHLRLLTDDLSRENASLYDEDRMRRNNLLFDSLAD